MNGNVARGQVALGEKAAHDLAVKVGFDFAPATLVTHGVDKSGARGGGPHFGGEFRVGGVDGSCVLSDQESYLAFVGLRVWSAVRLAGHRDGK